ncbi:hypothetical protein [Desulfovibrio litoralis]|uniref:Uncharacterized protein n=1 Tax=Desulfovibrio litoralis DSM 11393 TaxID=1121455 RepID=A0A1M7SCK3_9BACT|nr:hypothetical protein [Desulfovibrio litoralis]SHN56200.1 hypothetical protein SAMN02745728_00761 [Desulfovibrio litoralis DSM 11393]
MKQVSLKNEFGEEVCFCGRMISENAHYDDVSGVLTRNCLYEKENGEYVYFIVSGSGEEKKSRVYTMRREGDSFIINNGSLEMSIDDDVLLQNVLCQR